jgi:DNA-binding HxlR family transcriptional regulator
MVAKIEHKTRTGCPVACSLDIIGDHWTLLIIRNLMFLGLHEYKDMLATEEQISTSILSDRLKNLESGGLIASIPHPDSKRRKLYYLRPMGKDLIDTMTNLVLWANKHLQEWLKIPPDKKALLESDPEKFKEIVLQNLQSWEEEHNVNQNA